MLFCVGYWNIRFESTFLDFEATLPATVRMRLFRFVCVMLCICFYVFFSCFSRVYHGINFI